MAKKLTTKFIENAQPRAQTYEVKDRDSPLRLVVQPTRRKSWIVRYRRPPPDGRTAKLTHERFVPLAEARKWAAEAMAELARGNDPAALKLDAQAKAEKAAADRAADTIEQWAAEFIRRHASKKRPSTRQQVVHVLGNLVLPTWRGRVIHDITRRDVIDLIERLAEDRPIAANRALAWLSKFFNWLTERDVIAASPVHGVKRPSEERKRDRVLSDGEIIALWHACENIGGPSGGCIKLLLLTGQRRSEIAGMRRSEISDDVWTLPPERTKNKQRHGVPLSAQALAIIDAMRQFAGSDYVFTTTGKAPLGHFDQTKAEIDAQMKPSTPFVLHDLRRTVATGLQKLKVPLEVTEAVLNHTSGSRGGIVSVYQTHQYAPEKREALQIWAEHVDRLVSGRPAEDKVVSLVGRR
jgi:integrase